MSAATLCPPALNPKHPHQTDMDQRLAALLAEWSERPFSWGVTDCCQFARAAAWQLHGIVVDSPPYINERDALRTLHRMGGFPGLLAASGLRLRYQATSARRGDFVLARMPFENPDRPGLFPQGLAVVSGLVAHMPGARGLVSVPRRAWQDVWGVA